MHEPLIWYPVLETAPQSSDKPSDKTTDLYAIWCILFARNSCIAKHICCGDRANNTLPMAISSPTGPVSLFCPITTCCRVVKCKWWPPGSPFGSCLSNRLVPYSTMGGMHKSLYCACTPYQNYKTACTPLSGLIFGNSWSRHFVHPYTLVDTEYLAWSMLTPFMSTYFVCWLRSSAIGLLMVTWQLNGY